MFDPSMVTVLQFWEITALFFASSTYCLFGAEFIFFFLSMKSKRRGDGGCVVCDLDWEQSE